MTNHDFDEFTAALRDHDPAAGLDLDALDLTDLRNLAATDAEALDTLAGALTPEEPSAPVLRLRPSRRFVATGTVLLLVAGGGLAAAAASLFGGPRPETTGVQCILPHTFYVMPGSARPPLDVCREALADAGEKIPEDLVVFQAPEKYVAVAPRHLVPEGATMLNPAQGGDVRLAELSDAVEDVANGVGFDGRCRSGDQVDARLGEITRMLGMHDLSRTMSGSGPCVTVLVSGDGTTLEYINRSVEDMRPAGEPTTAEDRKFRQFDAELADIAGRDWGTVAQVRDAIDTAARDLGVSSDAYEMLVTESDVEQPLRMYHVVGGRAFIRIYAPASAI